MKKILVCFSFLLLSLIAFSQQVDTVIHTPIYTSYFNYQLHEPLIVTYDLFHGGGSCSRASDRFITDGLIESAAASDYAGNNYDEGHLADSKDFAFDCIKQAQTFRFYNCVPQKAKLNRGIWKHFETLIRKESQTDSLFIICGSFFGTKTIGANKIAVPDQCWKIVYNKHSKKIIHSLIFPNDDSDSFQIMDISELKQLIKEHYPFFTFTF